MGNPEGQNRVSVNCYVFTKNRNLEDKSYGTKGKMVVGEPKITPLVESYTCKVKFNESNEIVEAYRISSDGKVIRVKKGKGLKKIKEAHKKQKALGNVKEEHNKDNKEIGE